MRFSMGSWQGWQAICFYNCASFCDQHKPYIVYFGMCRGLIIIAILDEHSSMSHNPKHRQGQRAHQEKNPNLKVDQKEPKEQMPSSLENIDFSNQPPRVHNEPEHTANTSNAQTHPVNAQALTPPANVVSTTTYSSQPRYQIQQNQRFQGEKEELITNLCSAVTRLESMASSQLNLLQKMMAEMTETRKVLKELNQGMRSLLRIV